MVFYKSTLTCPWFSNSISHLSQSDTGEPDFVHTIVFLKPLSGTQLHLIILQQAFVKQLLNDFVIQILANED